MEERKGERNGGRRGEKRMKGRNYWGRRSGGSKVGRNQ